MKEYEKVQTRLSMMVLAGGQSSRMGTDKADLLLGSQTFLEHQIRKGRQLGISDILVSGYKGESCSVPVVPDRVTAKGPLGGMEACLRKAKEDHVLVLSVDVPLIPILELKRLIETSKESKKPVTILQHGEKWEPLIGVYRKDLADAMWEIVSEEKKSVFVLLRRVGYDIYESLASDFYFANINCPSDYTRIMKNSRELCPL